MIFHKFKCIFIHIPKTGGTTIEELFRLNDCPYIYKEKHFTASHAKSIYAPYWDEYFKFAFIRNPWERVYSIWYNLNHDGSYPIPFDGFISRVMPFHLLARPQYDWTHIDGEMALNYIGQFNEFPGNALNLLRQIGLTIESVPHMKAIDNKPSYLEYYTPELIEAVRVFYMNDINTWKFDFSK